MRTLGALLVAFAIIAGTSISQTFVDVTAAAGISVPPNASAAFGRGACFGDFDNDGNLDVIIAGGVGLPFYYYRNLGNGVFQDISQTSGLGMSGLARGVVAADYDNDGDLDVYVARSWQPNLLFRNANGLVFQEVGAQAGVNYGGGSFSASWGDYDRDGWLDLYVGNWETLGGLGEANVLYHNQANGTFSDVTASSGTGNQGYTFVGMFVDYDRDGWPDIFVANDKGYYPQNVRNTLYRNNGNGTFTDVSVPTNTNFGIGAMGADFADIHNDGDVDIFVSNTQAGHLLHVWNHVTNIYDELAAQYGVIGYFEAWGCALFDYDNDGWTDLYVVGNVGANRLYRNPSGGYPWPEVGAGLNVVVPGTAQFALAIGDYDNDGNVDLLLPGSANTAVLLRNPGFGGHWLSVRTVGTVSNRDGVGAVIRVTAGGITRRQVVRTGVGFLGGNDLRAHFGLGSATSANIAIVWPSGVVQHLDGVAANQVVTAVEPSLLAATPFLIGSASNIALAVQGDAQKAYWILLTLSTTPGIPLGDGRVLPLTIDPLLQLASASPNPILSGFTGVLPANAAATATLSVPNLPALSAFTCYAGAFTLDASYPSFIRTILRPIALTFY